jgi:hypothetical protein
MKRDHGDNTSRIGVYAVAAMIEKELGWIFREQPTSDHGIDAQVEVVGSRSDVTGRLIALQIKSGKSYFQESVEGGFVYRGDSNHLNYWARHSLPVIVVLHNPTTEAIYWQVVTPETIERTKNAWKMTVPTAQTLDKSAAAQLQYLADIPAEQQRLASLALAKSWMEMLKQGNRLFLKAEEWVNKSSGRGRLTLFTRDDNGKGEVVEDWPFVMFPGQLYVEVLPRLFPWADLEVDHEVYDDLDEDAWNEECGVWDSEDDRYIFHTEEYEDWLSRMAQIRPYEVASGEVALFQLELTLNEIGNAYLSLENYLSRGSILEPKPGSTGAGYAFGLKALARKYGLDSETKNKE